MAHRFHSSIVCQSSSPTWFVSDFDKMSLAVHKDRLIAAANVAPVHPRQISFLTSGQPGHLGRCEPHNKMRRHDLPTTFETRRAIFQRDTPACDYHLDRFHNRRGDKTLDERVAVAEGLRGLSLSLLPLTLEAISLPHLRISAFRPPAGKYGPLACSLTVALDILPLYAFWLSA
jgi:hypothetical protein